MYSYIKGTLEEIMTDSVVIDNHGIGYRIDVPGRVITQLPDPGAEVKIYTYLHVKEDCFSLYGFLNREELGLFRMMLGVSGIGPKGALGILTVLSPEDLIVAISCDDAKTIAKAPGIGNKTAQKLIIELKDKVNLEDIFPAETAAAAEHADELSGIVQESVEALVSLGYTVRDAKEVLGGIEIDESMGVEQVLKEALKRMAFL